MFNVFNVLATSGQGGCV